MARIGRRALLLAGGGGLLAGCAIPNGPTRDFSSSMDGTGPVRHAYGDEPSQFGELTRPAGTPRGTVVVIHGGFWKVAYTLDLGRPLATSLADAGWNAWNLEYRRVGSAAGGGGDGGGGGVPATLDDVSVGIDHLRGLEVDLRRPVLAVGHSAGGHLAVWAAGRRDPGVALTGVVSQAGVLDLRSAFDDDLGSGAVQAFLGHPYSDADRSVDPLRQVPLAVPVACVHGTADDVVPLRQSQDYVRAATAAGATATLTTIDGGDHFTLIDPESDAWHRTLGLLDDLGRP